MATVKWSAAVASLGNVLTTELNALANAAYSAIGSEIDNGGANLNKYFWLELNLGSLTPGANPTVQIFATLAPSGNYEDPPSATNSGYPMSLGSFPIATGTGTKRVTVPAFQLPPMKIKFVLLNSAGVALAATGNTLTLYAANDAVN